MNNVPAVDTFNRDIPAGKVLLAEYGQLGPNDPRPVHTVLDTKTGWGRTDVRLVAITAGWAIAGSCARWDNGCYAVLWEVDGARHGTRYRDFESALAHFNRIPTKPYGEA